MSLFAHPLRLTTVTHNITELLHGLSVRRRLSLEPISCTLRVRTSADSAASNISSDASAEIALIMLIKLVCLLIGPVKVPILVCPGRLPRYRSIRLLRYVKSSVILGFGRYDIFVSTSLCSMLYIVFVTIFSLPSRYSLISCRHRILNSIELIIRLCGSARQDNFICSTSDITWI